MNYLRYSSDEMFSSTELIRKSKKIFDKLNKNEIEKAVILRDGKPGFMLLDFETYENLMKEYLKLKDKKIESVEVAEKVQEIVQEDIKTKEEIVKIQEVIPEITAPIELEEIKELSEEKTQKEPIDELIKEEVEDSIDKSIEVTAASNIQKVMDMVEKNEIETPEVKEESTPVISDIDDIPNEEINDDDFLKALEDIENMVVSPQVEEKAISKDEEKKEGFDNNNIKDTEAIEDDFEMELNIEEDKPKKSQPLKEFWD